MTKREFLTAVTSIEGLPAELVEYALEQVPQGPADTLEQVLEADAAAREAVREGFSRR